MKKVLVFDDWLRTKKRVEELARQCDKIEAEFKHAMEQIKKKDKVRTIKAAEKRLKRKTREEIEIHKEWVQIEKVFKKKYRKRLEL